MKCTIRNVVCVVFEPSSALLLLVGGALLVLKRRG